MCLFLCFRSTAAETTTTPRSLGVWLEEQTAAFSIAIRVGALCISSLSKLSKENWVSWVTELSLNIDGNPFWHKELHSALTTYYINGA